MLILLEAIYPIPLVKAMQAALLAHPDGSIRVEKDGPFVEENPGSPTVVFMLNRGNQISPAIRLRCKEYRVFVVKLRKGESLVPFRLTLQILSMLQKILDVIRADKTPFVCLLQLNKKSLRKLTLAPMKQVASAHIKASPKPRRTRRTRSGVDNTLILFER